MCGGFQVYIGFSGFWAGKIFDAETMSGFKVSGVVKKPKLIGKPEKPSCRALQPLGPNPKPCPGAFKRSRGLGSGNYDANTHPHSKPELYPSQNLHPSALAETNFEPKP